MRAVGVAVVLTFGLIASSRAAEYYVAPTGGSDANNGSIGSPFATFTKAITSATAGDTIFARGGTYNLTNQVAIDKSGNAASPIKFFAYPGETPVLDFSAMSDSDGNRGVRLSNNSNWWHVKGLTIQHAGDNGLYTEGDDGIFEQLVLRQNRDSGLQLHGSATRNLVLNCDSYENFDPPDSGEDADGFAAKFAGLGPGNIFRGNRAWSNSDDGWDTWNSANGVLIQDCWSFDNGINIWGVPDFAGDGTGYKLGKPGGTHVLANVLAIDNRNGVDINENGSFVQVYNSTSFSNSRNWQFDDDNGALHLLKNNISLSGSQSDNFDSATHSFNTWDGAPFVVDSGDFLSTDRFVNAIDLLKQIRKQDGSLPDLEGFLHLAANSNLVDAGTPITFTFNGVIYSLAFNGSSPDLGAYETAAAGPVLPGDYNGDNVVDSADYTMWRDHLDSSFELANDETPGSVDPEDYGVWKAHFGETHEVGASVALKVPEPAAWLLTFLAAIGTTVPRLRRR